MKKIIFWTLIAAVCVIIGLVSDMTLLFKRMSAVSKGEPIPVYSSEKGALLVIDVQEGLTGDLGNFAVKDFKSQSDILIRTINKAVDWADANNMPVAYIRQESVDPIYNMLTGGLTAKGSPASQIDKRVKVSGSNIFSKQKMDAFSNPELDSFLRSMKITRLYVTGLDAAYCVDRTIKGALGRGYKVTAVKDAIISAKAGKRDTMIAKYTAEGVSLTASAELRVVRK